jgi:hypothetical protein
MCFWAWVESAIRLEMRCQAFDKARIVPRIKITLENWLSIDSKTPISRRLSFKYMYLKGKIIHPN